MMNSDLQSFDNAGEAFDRDGFLVVKQHYRRQSMLDGKPRIVNLQEEQGGVYRSRSGGHVWSADGLDSFPNEQILDRSAVPRPAPSNRPCTSGVGLLVYATGTLVPAFLQDTSSST